MHARAALVLVATATATVVVTLWLGWPAPALVGAGVGVVARAWGARSLASPARAAAGAALGWALLLARAAFGGHAPGVVQLVGSLAGARGPGAFGATVVVACITLALGAALAWAGATLVTGVLGVGRASAPGRVTLSGTAAADLARRAERAPAAQTP